jgi:hypothetical protein
MVDRFVVHAVDKYDPSNAVEPALLGPFLGCVKVDRAVTDGIIRAANNLRCFHEIPGKNAVMPA